MSPHVWYAPIQYSIKHNYSPGQSLCERHVQTEGETSLPSAQKRTPRPHIAIDQHFDTGTTPLTDNMPESLTLHRILENKTMNSLSSKTYSQIDPCRGDD